MLWSNWRGALAVLLLSGVGLVWSQAPRTTKSAAPERFMTVHENGKPTRCRVVAEWRMGEGAKAYQLQIVATGAMMTIVEDGPTAAVPGTKMKGMPMRIYHWGNSKSAPPGVPTPPQVAQVAPKQAAPKVVPTSHVVPAAPVVVSQAPARSVQTPCVQCNECCEKPGLLNKIFAPKHAPTVIDCTEKVVWWEEKDGQRISPTIVTAGHNPFEQKNVVLPGNAPAVANAMGTTPPKPKTVVHSESVVTLPATKTNKTVAPAPKSQFSTAADNAQRTITTAEMAGGKTKKEFAKAPERKTQLPGKTTVETARSSDPLLHPERFAPKEEKMLPKGINMNAFKGEFPVQSMPVQSTPTPSATPVPAKSPMMTAQAPKVPQLLQSKPGRWPLGAQSVLAASGGNPGAIMYIPVPIATVPEPYRPPVPPAALPPDAGFVNAFTPALPNHGIMVHQHPHQQQLMQANWMAQQQMMAQRNMLQSSPMVPIGYNPITQTGGYHGPRPPSPPVMPAVYNSAMHSGQVNQAMDRRTGPATVTQVQHQEVAGLLKVLRESPFPAQREWAANSLAECSSMAHEVVPALLTGAQHDKAAIVRASCVYGLARLNANNAQVLSVLQHLRNDADPRVRQEADHALARFGMPMSR
ncbi:MAG: HEAT repeat domain-containing protein [Gemmataceae bacterium]|nr:HEAT repeat domain-containing protein [Gemmataceae bacterium]